MEYFIEAIINAGSLELNKRKTLFFGPIRECDKLYLSEIAIKIFHQHGDDEGRIRFSLIPMTDPIQMENILNFSLPQPLKNNKRKK